MIIYGAKDVHLKTVKSTTGICPNCKIKGELSINIFRRHAHIFWIPLFPLWKKGISECSHCKKVMKYREMPESVKLEYQNLKIKTKGPIWQFIGIILIIVLALGVTAMNKFGSKSYQKEKLELFASPLKGDVYEYEIRTGKYSTLKVKHVSADSIFFSPNNYESSSLIRLYKINKEENYSDKIYSMSREKLKAMYTKGKIFGVKRE
ncbi:hypothetical protein [Aestuariivivens insulae]|uniref:hypothetical protein n=1 Tax=Aestuariivivens insulae TaxID=1621988 RepID=UPI001F592B32|nr:hypothetical protein [Aestuariivivens insulae]